MKKKRYTEKQIIGAIKQYKSGVKVDRRQFFSLSILLGYKPPSFRRKEGFSR